MNACTQNKHKRQIYIQIQTYLVSLIGRTDMFFAGNFLLKYLMILEMAPLDNTKSISTLRMEFVGSTENFSELQLIYVFICMHN